MEQDKKSGREVITIRGYRQRLHNLINDFRLKVRSENPKEKYLNAHNFYNSVKLSNLN